MQRLTVQVWDTAGQEQFHSLTSTYYRKAGGVMIMYDCSNRKSFESVPRWLEVGAVSSALLHHGATCVGLGGPCVGWSMR